MNRKMQINQNNEKTKYEELLKAYHKRSDRHVLVLETFLIQLPSSSRQNINYFFVVFFLFVETFLVRTVRFVV